MTPVEARTRDQTSRWLALALLAVLAGCGADTQRVTSRFLDDFDAGKRIATLPNGESIAYVDRGRTSGPTIVLIHGYTDSARDWVPIVPLLERRYHLIIPDLRGHGRSTKPDCCYTRFDFAFDIKLLLDQLGLPDAIIVGHSLGSLVAQTYAELWPQKTDKLVLISSTGKAFGPGPLAAPAGNATTRLPGWLREVATLADPIDPDSAFMREWWHESVRINPPYYSTRQRRDAAAIPARVWRAIAEQSLIAVDLESALPSIEAPTLLIWGERDAVMGAEGRDALRHGLRRATEKTFAGLGHDLFWEDPKSVASAIERFIE